MSDYIIVAGVNGAGKSTLFETQPGLFKASKRVNADEILRQQQGDWRKRADNFRAMRQELILLKQTIMSGKSLHVETTLAGNGRTQLDLIELAHQQGYSITLLYVVVANAQLAVKRVQQRVLLGGHGVPTELVYKRYQQSLSNLGKLAQYCDNIQIFDNSQLLTLIYARQQQRVSLDLLVSVPGLPLASTLQYKMKK
jgi:predicted ABC-type ATPase